MDALRAALGPDAPAIIGCAFALCAFLIFIAWLADRRER